MFRLQMIKLSSGKELGTGDIHAYFNHLHDFYCTTVFLYLSFVNDYYPPQLLAVGWAYLVTICCSCFHNILYLTKKRQKYHFATLNLSSANALNLVLSKSLFFSKEFIMQWVEMMTLNASVFLHQELILQNSRIHEGWYTADICTGWFGARDKT